MLSKVIKMFSLQFDLQTRREMATKEVMIFESFVITKYDMIQRFSSLRICQIVVVRFWWYIDNTMLRYKNES